ncbi:hypothetical protein MASR2M50_03240 [Thauera sp.]
MTYSAFPAVLVTPSRCAEADASGPEALRAHDGAPRKTSYNYEVLRLRRARPVCGSGRGVPIPVRRATVEGDGAGRGALAPKHAINLFAAAAVVAASIEGQP